MREQIIHYGGSTYIVLEKVPGHGITRAAGVTVPSDGAIGFATGCVFAHLDGGAATALYVNEGDDDSADFNPVLGTLGGVETVTTTNVILASESGKTFFLDAAGGFTSTLPAPAAGLEFSFVVKTAPTTAYVIATNAGSNIIVITVNELETDTGDDGPSDDDADTVNFVANVALPGDRIDFKCDGVKWYAAGQVRADGAVTTSTT
jgi:hypothetical protein